MRLRPATLEDVALLRHWDAQPHVVESDPNDDWQWETELLRTPPWRESLIAEVDGRPVGFLEIIDPQQEDSHYWGDCGPGLRAIDIWIGEAHDLGRGLGTDMMLRAIERCFAVPDVRAALVDPLSRNVRARRFYERLGFRHVEDRWFGDDHCAVHRLERWATGSGTPAESLEVREAGVSEVRALQLSIMRPEGPLPTDHPLPPDAVHVGAFDDGMVVAAASILENPWAGPGELADPAWQLRSMVVRADRRGSGAGARVLEQAVASARSRGAAALWATARVRALGFYTRRGWQVVGPEWIKPGVGPHRWIVLGEG
jgi:aminoglycoside 6'-N-acetyltransferase